MSEMQGLTAKLQSRYLRWTAPLVEESFADEDIDKRKQSKTPWTAILLVLISIIGLAVTAAEYAKWKTAIVIASVVVWALILLTLVALRPRTFSLMLSVLYVAVVACQVVQLVLFNKSFDVYLTLYAFSILSSLLSLTTILNMPLRPSFLPRDGISQPYTPPTARLRSPEDNLTMWQWMTVSWMAPMIETGSQRQLNDDDVWQLAYEFQHTHLHEAFRALTGSVVTRLLKANWLDLIILTSLALIDLAANYSVPVITQKLLQAMQEIDTYRIPAISWAILIMVTTLVTGQSAVFATWFSRRAYERSRGAMITMIHEKVLNRQIIGGVPKDKSEKNDDGDNITFQASHEIAEGQMVDEQTEPDPIETWQSATRGLVRTMVGSVKDRILALQYKSAKASDTTTKEVASMGKILNIMRNDVYEVSQRFWEFQNLLTAPIGLIISLILVWRMMGWPSMIGICVVVLGQVVNAFLAKGLLNNEKVRRKATDHKLQQITQYIEAIRHLRWYGWHMRKIESLLDARQKELNRIVLTNMWGAAIFFINILASGVLPVAAFWAYTKLAGRDLTVDIAFPALQVFLLLQTNLRDIPQLITVLLNASIALGRIEDFMKEPDVKTDNTFEAGRHLELKNTSFAWPGFRMNVLQDLNISFQPGLTVIVGQVASGKTALLQGLLGELDLRAGQMFRPDIPIGYCAQTPWLESMTIRDNILFCSPFDEARYKHVLEACALLPDLDSFPQGDHSPIGENGIGLSGGQKARVALARALYSQSEILLLDDPLSALDQQTAEWIVKHCFSGKLIENRTVLLVTHRIDLCQGISEAIVDLSNGRATVYKDTRALTEDKLHLSKTRSVPEERTDKADSDTARKKFEDEEFRAHGGLDFRVYWEYVRAGKLKWWFLVVATLLLSRLLDYVQRWFLKAWGEAYKTESVHLLFLLQGYPIRASDASPINRFFEHLPSPDDNVDPWLLWFMVLVILQSVMFLLSQVMRIIVTYIAGRNMFRRIMFKISNATFVFYDVTPIGRLMNRLTGDVSTVDGPMSNLVMGFSWEVISWTLSLIIIATITPLFTIFSLAMVATFVYVFRQFLPTSQSLRRLEMVSLSPLMSNFGALLTGLTTVRAFHAQSQFRDRTIRVTDAFQKQDHFYWSLQSWLTYRFEVLSAISTLILTLIAIYSGFSPGLTAFVLVAAQAFVQSTYRLCKSYGQLQLDFVSVERVIELLDLDQEDPGDSPPPAYWPLLSSKNPAVEFQNVTIRYASHLEPALKDISFSIPAGSSTAIIGRTGSGKSTLALSILATMTPDSGRVLVDGIDIARVTKQDLRSRVTFLAQEPVLFQGTLRTNLDPMEDYSDGECASVLHRIHGDSHYNWSLKTVVEAGGKNLSQGQRQLVGLARAMLRRSAIIIMDEATASVDLETSWEIQRVLKEELAGSTIITIAHRASAVRDCDFVVKLNKGKLDTFGPPDELEREDDVAMKDDSQLLEETLIEEDDPQTFEETTTGVALMPLDNAPERQQTAHDTKSSSTTEGRSNEIQSVGEDQSITEQNLEVQNLQSRHIEKRVSHAESFSTSTQAHTAHTDERTQTGSEDHRGPEEQIRHEEPTSDQEQSTTEQETEIRNLQSQNIAERISQAESTFTSTETRTSRTVERNESATTSTIQESNRQVGERHDASTVELTRPDRAEVSEDDEMVIF